MSPPKIFTIAAVLAAVALAGCGGGGDSTDSTAATTEATVALSKDDLIARGDGICAETNAAIGAIAGSEAEVPEQIIQVSDLYVGMVEKLKGFGAPDDEAGYPELIAAADELAQAEGEAKLAAEREDTAALGEAASRATPALEEFESVAGEYGFEECSKGPQAPSAAGTGSAPSEEAPVEEGGIEAAPEAELEAPVEEAAPEEAAPETGGAGGAGGGVEEAAPEAGGGSAGGGGSSSGGVGPG